MIVPQSQRTYVLVEICKIMVYNQDITYLRRTEHILMENGNTIKIFPDYFSDGAIEKIKLWGNEDEIKVYRVSKHGDIKLAFLNSYEEIVEGLIKVRESDKEKRLKKCQVNIDSLSVSCYYQYKDIEYYYDVTLKDDYPERKLLEGKTVCSCGLSQITDIRKNRVKDSHVDWWLYCGATPWMAFSEVNDNE